MCDDVAWEEREKAMKKISPAFRKFVTKLSIGWLSTNYKLKQWGLLEDDRCAGCSQSETNDHLWCCTTNLETREETIAKVCKELDRWNMNADVKEDIVNLLRGNSDDAVYTTTGGKMLCNEGISMWRGCVLKSWIRKQQQHIDMQKKDCSVGDRASECETKQYGKSGIAWAEKATIAIWNASYQIWMNRNEKIHEVTDGNNRDIIQAKKEVTAIQGEMWKLRWMDRQFLEMTLNKTAEESVASLKVWIANAKTIMETMKEKQKNTAKGLLSWLRGKSNITNLQSIRKAPTSEKSGGKKWKDGNIQSMLENVVSSVRVGSWRNKSHVVRQA